MKKYLIFFLSLTIFSCASNQSSKLYLEYFEPVNGIDKRLGVFLEQSIDNEKDYENVIDQFKNKPISLEFFIYQVFTSKIKFDTTKDNTLMLVKLGQYLSKEQPKISKELYDDLVKFNESNNTFMREMLLTTLNDLL